MTTPPARKLSTTVYLTREQVERLRKLSESTHVSSAEYIRQGVDLILARHEELLTGQASLFKG